MACIICNNAHCAHYRHTMRTQERFKPAIALLKESAELLRKAEQSADRINKELDNEAEEEESRV